MKLIPKHDNHKTYWVDSEQLYETYEKTPNTDIILSRHLLYVKGMPDIEKLNRNDIDQITKEYLNK